jgi:Domain of unknown function (DUF4375)
MESIISKEEVNSLIEAGIDYDDEIFSRICEIVDGTVSSLSKIHKLYQMIYTTCVIEGEICNGGFYQYYGNSTAQEFNAIGIECFRMIEAHKTADVLSKAYQAILQQSPIFKEEYGIIGIQDAFNKANDEYNQIDIEEYDERFFRAIEEDDLKKLRLKYIKKAALDGWVE